VVEKEAVFPIIMSLEMRGLANEEEEEWLGHACFE
jgi:hypothetical protein